MWLLLLANCLRKVHACDLAHGAISPDAFLVCVCPECGQLEFKLADFTSAHHISEPADPPPPTLARLGYCAPEVLQPWAATTSACPSSPRGFSLLRSPGKDVAVDVGPPCHPSQVAWLTVKTNFSWTT